MTESGFTLREGLDLAGISFDELYLGYLTMGGEGTEADLRQHLHDDANGDDHEHNMIAQALNDVFVEVGQDHPVGYRNLSAPPEREAD